MPRTFQGYPFPLTISPGFIDEEQAATSGGDGGSDYIENLSLFNIRRSIAFIPEVEQFSRIVWSLLGDDMKNDVKVTEIDCRIWEMVVDKRFSRSLKGEIDFLMREALDLFIIKIQNMEFCLSHITTVVATTREVAFV